MSDNKTPNSNIPTGEFLASKLPKTTRIKKKKLAKYLEKRRISTTIYSYFIANLPRKRTYVA